MSTERDCSFSAAYRLCLGTLLVVIQKQPKIYTMDGPDKLRIKLPMPEGADRFNAARGLLAALTPG
ncbi:hypothetical protein [Xanthomonas floridensis]|uniref:Uncharacterized protein n=1 Tax=Xanthomonas floridensis TaxID=1843580 RepID=A0ABU5PWJ1_9XANT|nr:hypothetical protein [Xanthomonas floridensis]MEA5123654.1 hypothetical protein [Xanthomonas floridensis]MEA5130520.1 hypothetical protein [Xanthomonas floridensis]